MKFIDYLFIYSVLILIGLCIAIPVISQIDIPSRFYPLYDNKTQVIPVYKDVTEKVSYECVKDNKTMIISACSKDTVIKVFDKMETITISSDIIGYSDGYKDIKGYVNEYKGAIIKWEYDIKGRNLKDNPSCVQYEIDKGFCNEIY